MPGRSLYWPRWGQGRDVSEIGRIDDVEIDAAAFLAGVEQLSAVVAPDRAGLIQILASRHPEAPVAERKALIGSGFRLRSLRNGDQLLHLIGLGIDQGKTVSIDAAVGIGHDEMLLKRMIRRMPRRNVLGVK